MDLFHRHNLSLGKALLAQRMLLRVRIPYSLPGSAVTSAGSRVATVLLVLLIGELLMLFAVPAVSKSRAAGVRTWMLWFCRHRVFLLSRQQKSPAGFSREAILMLFCYCNSNRFQYALIVPFTARMQEFLFFLMQCHAA